MTLDEAVASALANHPRLRASHATERATDARADDRHEDAHDGRRARSRQHGWEAGPGMFADVAWPVKKGGGASLFLPPSALVVTTEKTFVVRVKEGVVDQVSVQRGVSAGDLIEVLGDLHRGDLVAKRGSEEMRAGAKVQFKVAAGDAK